MSLSTGVRFETTSLKVTLGRVARELTSLHAAIQSLERMICEDILNWERLNSTDVVEIQKLDLVVQTVGELGRFLSRLEAEVTSDQLIDLERVLNDVRLEKLARSLGQGDTATADDRSNRTAGEVDFF